MFGCELAEKKCRKFEGQGRESALENPICYKSSGTEVIFDKVLSI